MIKINSEGQCYQNNKGLIENNNLPEEEEKQDG